MDLEVGDSITIKAMPEGDKLKKDEQAATEQTITTITHGQTPREDYMVAPH